MPDGLNVDGDVLWIEGSPLFRLDDAEQLDPVVMDIIAGGLPDLDRFEPSESDVAGGAGDEA